MKCAPVPRDVPPPELSPAAAKNIVAKSTPESAWLGMDPSRVVLQDGPLTVAGLGADPPSGSVHFHLSLMSLDGAVARELPVRVPPSHLSVVLSAASKLNTKWLTVVKGEDIDHGLVWEEGSLDLGVAPAFSVNGNSMREYLPEGDGEIGLRRFIDDSVNLLSELPVNYERAEEGLPPLNLLWPWGPGFRETVPNLGLRRGAICWVESSSLRLRGLARLAGYRHGNRGLFGRGVRVNFDYLMDSILRHDCMIVVIDAFSTLRSPERADQMEWLMNTIDKEVLQPLWDWSRDGRLRLCLVAPGYDYSLGLGLSFDSAMARSNIVPFHERALEEKSLALEEVWRFVDEALS